MGDKDAWELPLFKLQHRSIRYFLLPASNSSIVGNSAFQNNFILFLGADVLKGCGNYAVKNLGRLHSKCAAEGLATKVSFPVGCRIKGVRGTGESIWFYSIQGLFKIGFEFYSRQEQKDLLEKLQTEWISRIDDSFLEQEVFIPAQKSYNHKKLTLECNFPSKIDAVDSHLNNTITNKLAKSTTEKSTEMLNGSNIKSQENSIYKELPENQLLFKKDFANLNSGYQDVNLAIQCSIKNSEQIGFFEETCIRPEVVSHLLINGSKSGPGPQNAAHCKSKIQLHCQKLEKMLSEIFSHYEDEASCEIVLSYLQTFIALCLQEKENIVNNQSTAFPIKLIKDYMEAKSLKLSSYQDDELAIHVLASWVGEKFQVFKGIIKENVNAFKQKHINSISELPQPEDIIKELYPSSMYSLLYLWIRGPEDEARMQNSKEAVEAKFAVSLCLLTLELLNDLPITGIGHYIHSFLHTA